MKAHLQFTRMQINKHFCVVLPVGVSLRTLTTRELSRLETRPSDMCLLDHMKTLLSL